MFYYGYREEPFFPEFDHPFTQNTFPHQCSYGCNQNLMNKDMWMPKEHDLSCQSPNTEEQETLPELLDQCSAMCQEALGYTFSQTYPNRDHPLSLLFDCANICDNQLDLIVIKSPFAKQHAKFCGEVCQTCASVCAKHQLSPLQNICQKTAQACIDYANR